MEAAPAPSDFLPRPSLRASSRVVAIQSDMVWSQRLFDLSKSAPGSYRVAVVGIGGVLDAVSLEVTNHDFDSLGLQVTRPADILGLLHWEDNRSRGDTPRSSRIEPDSESPARLVLKTLYENLPSPPATSVKNDGTFSFLRVHSGNSGSYRLTVNAGNDGAYIKVLTINGLETPDLSVTVTGESYKIEVAASLNGGSLRGVVVDQEGEPVPGASTTLIPEDASRSDLYKSTLSDQNGQYMFSGLAPGQYRVYAWETLAQDAQFDPSFVNRHQSRGLALTSGDKVSLQLQIKLITNSDIEADDRVTP